VLGYTLDMVMEDIAVYETVSRRMEMKKKGLKSELERKTVPAGI
jgi:hypothetical protein